MTGFYWVLLGFTGFWRWLEEPRLAAMPAARHREGCGWRPAKWSFRITFRRRLGDQGRRLSARARAHLVADYGTAKDSALMRRSICFVRYVLFVLAIANAPSLPTPPPAALALGPPAHGRHRWFGVFCVSDAATGCTMVLERYKAWLCNWTIVSIDKT